jgi:hypothetical protein
MNEADIRRELAYLKLDHAGSNLCRKLEGEQPVGLGRWQYIIDPISCEMWQVDMDEYCKRTQGEG